MGLKLQNTHTIVERFLGKLRTVETSKKITQPLLSDFRKLGLKLQKSLQVIERFRKTRTRNFKKVHRSLLSVLEN
jgi:hypothetical protein